MNETFSAENHVQMNPYDSIQDDNQVSHLEIINNPLNKEDFFEIENNKFSKNKNQETYQNYKNLENIDLTSSNIIISPRKSIFDNHDFDNTLNLETNSEDRIDNIILQKLNQKNHDLDFELQEAKENNFMSNSLNFNYNSNSEYSSRSSEETDREFFEKIIVNVKTPIEEFHSKTFNFIKCENITTLKIDKNKFSYLTNPTNKDDLFFIKYKEEKSEFQLEDFNYYNKHLIKYTKIPFHVLNKFIEAINKPLSGLEFEIRKLKFSHNIKFLLKCFGFFLIFFSCVVWFNYRSEDLFTYNIETKSNIILGLWIAYVLILLYKIYYFRKSKLIDYYINKILIERQEQLDPILYKWNADYFIQKMDYLAVMPKNLKYIMIIMKPNKKILLQDHPLRE